MRVDGARVCWVAFDATIDNGNGNKNASKQPDRFNEQKESFCTCVIGESGIRPANHVAR